jgi:protein-tyrosine-phosphatase
MKRYDRLIFVSNSDTCRGPMAKGILKSKYLLEDLEVDSRGLVVLFPEPANQRAEAVMELHGLDISSHAAEPLDASDFDERTLILTMDESNQRKIYESYENAVNVHLLSVYVGCVEEVKNPYGGGLRDYDDCYDRLEEYITKLVVLLNEEELLC